MILKNFCWAVDWEECDQYSVGKKLGFAILRKIKKKIWFYRKLELVLKKQYGLLDMLWLGITLRAKCQKQNSLKFLKTAPFLIILAGVDSPTIFERAWGGWALKFSVWLKIWGELSK